MELEKLAKMLGCEATEEAVTAALEALRDKLLGCWKIIGKFACFRGGGIAGRAGDAFQEVASLRSEVPQKQTRRRGWRGGERKARDGRMDCRQLPITLLSPLIACPLIPPYPSSTPPRRRARRRALRRLFSSPLPSLHAPFGLQRRLVPPLPRPRRMPLAHRRRQRPDVPRPPPAPLARVHALLPSLVQRMPPPPRPVGMPPARTPRQTPHVPRLVSAPLALVPHLTRLRSRCNRQPRQIHPQNEQQFHDCRSIFHRHASGFPLHSTNVHPVLNSSLMVCQSASIDSCTSARRSASLVNNTQRNWL